MIKLDTRLSLQIDRFLNIYIRHVVALEKTSEASVNALKIQSEALKGLREEE
jgi:hypothetical protein